MVDEVAVFIPIIALMIPVVAIVMTNWSKVRNRQLDILERKGTSLSDDAQARVERLEERVQVLERIATDKRLTLADEINQLKG